MKKLFVIVLLVALVAGGGYAYRTLAPPSEEAVPVPSRGQFKKAVTGLLAEELEQRGHGIDILVLGALSADGGRQFRGSLTADVNNVPFFGSLIAVCGAWEDLRCWHLNRLVINGKDVPLPPPAADAGVGGGPATTLESNSGTAVDTAIGGKVSLSIPPKLSGDKPDEREQGRRQGKGEAGKAAAPPQAPALPQAPAQESQSRPWFTKSDQVNARGGPGTEYKKLYAMPSSVPMRLMEKRDGWGRFAFELNDDSEGNAWISLKLVGRR
ncbi:MAG: hypothetical protein IIC56_05305 [Proteobacteria bacterium]|nr:hypothetical protein [Pseudomonadota bacterium]